MRRELGRIQRRVREQCRLLGLRPRRSGTPRNITHRLIGAIFAVHEGGDTGHGAQSDERAGEARAERWPSLCEQLQPGRAGLG